MESKKTTVFKIVKKEGSIYKSLHKASCYYALFKDTFDFRSGLIKGIWCYRSISRAQKSLSHFAEKYNIPLDELVILKGLASWRNSQRRTGGILIVEEVVFLREV